MSRKQMHSLLLIIVCLLPLNMLGSAEIQPARYLPLTVFDIENPHDITKATVVQEAVFDFNHFFYTPNDYNAYYDNYPGDPQRDRTYTGEEVGRKTIGYAEFQVNQPGHMLMHATKYLNKHEGRHELPRLTLQKWDDKEQKWNNLGLPTFKYESLPGITNAKDLMDPKIPNPCWRNYGTGSFRVAVWAARNHDHRSVYESSISFSILFRPDTPWIDDQEHVHTSDPGLETKDSMFGTSTYEEFALRGDLYFLPVNTSSIPDFKTMDPVGSIYSRKIDIPNRNFREGFPGVTDRYEWFGIKYTGKFHVSQPGTYKFRTYSDDGSILYINGKKIIDNDGIHPPRSAWGECYLSRGVHNIRLDYFQGPAAGIALQLFITPPDGIEEIFSPEYASNKDTCDLTLWGTQKKGTGPLSNAVTDGNKIFLPAGGKILSQKGENDGYALWSQGISIFVVNSGESSAGRILPPGEYSVIPGLGENLSSASVELCIQSYPVQ